jgi:methyltransferase (TIGR00027 family)
VDKISETAYLVAQYRALESQRSDALFQDPLAQGLAGSRGQRLRAIFKASRSVGEGIAIRTRIMDDLILEQVGTIDRVLNLGAGLDTRPYRLPLPKSLSWIEVDFPDILADKAEKLKHDVSNCELQRIALDLASTQQRRSLFSTLNANSGRTLVITEGLLGYLCEAQVHALTQDLLQPYICGWLLELFPPLLQQQWQNSRSGKMYNDYFNQGDPTFQFAPQAGPTFFRSSGWQVAEVKSLWSETERLNRMGLRRRMLAPVLRWVAPDYWQALMESRIILLTPSRDTAH